MKNYKKIRNSFTSFISKIIINTSINYKRKITYINKREEELKENFTDINNDILDTFVEEVNYLQLEKVFSNTKYTDAMSKLTDREKLILYLIVIDEKSVKDVAKILKLSENNVTIIKYRAKNKFLKNLKK